MQNLKLNENLANPYNTANVYLHQRLCVQEILVTCIHIMLVGHCYS